VRRRLFEAPAWLYRAGLGFLLGGRFVMLEHRGRRSGRRYRTVLEVIRHDRATGERFVVSGFGPDADWYRNVVAGGLEAVWVGSRSSPATARILDEDEAADELARYQAAHPRVAARLLAMVGLDPTVPMASLVVALPVVAFSVDEARRTSR
jgi:deazaflavin-dependent oxidoreductase (nitroreductase family)